MFPSKITKEVVNDLPLIQYEGKITVIDNEDDYHVALDVLKGEPVVGFDTEKKPVFVRGQYNHVALLQMAIPDEVFIFRLNLIGMRNGLKGVFENPDIRKVGISIRDDLQDLKKMNSFEPQNIYELNDAAARLGIENQGVRNLSGIFLNGRVSKNQQTSNWESPILTDKQLTYAATDAWVCLEIYQLLEVRGLA